MSPVYRAARHAIDGGEVDAVMITMSPFWLNHLGRRLQQQTNVPVWLMGTSMGTLSATFVTTELPRESGGPDGLVLTSTILSFPGARAVPGMPLGFIKVPVLLVHHRQDGCDHCKVAELPQVMDKLSGAPRKELMLFEGGSVRNPDPCEAFTHHGYLGIESDVVAKIAAWIVR